MSNEKKHLRFALLAGVITCIIIGGAAFYYQKQNEDAVKYIPEIGLPNGEEFVGLLQETKIYWSSKIDLASYMPKRLPQSKPTEENSQISRPEPILYIEEFDDPEQKISQPEFKTVIADTELIQETTPEAVLPPTKEVEVLEPSYAPVEPPPPEFRYEIEQDELQVEGVLVPEKTTVISSSRDGKIKDIFVENGDLFEKGQILLTYDCEGLNAQIEALAAEEKLAKQKVEKGQELFKLDIISDLEKMELQVEEQRTLAETKSLKAEMDSCIIRASYDGRVTNRLANPEEYTRTDRVLMEIASRDNLNVEFIVPSVWLRYINVGAPLTVNIAETQSLYEAEIVRIHGEVDPVSQSIQMSAKLLDYNDLLLPGMSGLVEIDPYLIREKGIKGYLEAMHQKADSAEAKPETVSRGVLQRLKEKSAAGEGNG